MRKIRLKCYGGGGVIPKLDLGLYGFMVYKSVYGFNPEYVPMCYFFPWIIRVLSPIDYARTFCDKTMTYSFFNNIKQPKLIARKTRGLIINEFGDKIEEGQVVDYILKSDSAVVIKQASGTCGGHGVQFIQKGTDRTQIDKMVKDCDFDCVIQRAIKQSKVTACFNDSSLNTFRISTLLLNGEFSVCTSMLRFGNPGSNVDNLASGGGCVGINEDGTLMSYGFNTRGEKISEWNNIVFRGVQIPEYEKIVETARKAHFDIPMCAFVGWDLAIDEKGDVNLIEANVDWPGLFFEQLANAKPVFGERFEEVMTWIKNHPLPLQPIYNTTN